MALIQRDPSLNQIGEMAPRFLLRVLPHPPAAEQAHHHQWNMPIEPHGCQGPAAVDRPAIAGRVSARPGVFVRLRMAKPSQPRLLDIAGGAGLMTWPAAGVCTQPGSWRQHVSNTCWGRLAPPGVQRRHQHAGDQPGYALSWPAGRSSRPGGNTAEMAKPLCRSSIHTRTSGGYHAQEVDHQPAATAAFASTRRWRGEVFPEQAGVGWRPWPGRCPPTSNPLDAARGSSMPRVEHQCNGRAQLGRAGR